MKDGAHLVAREAFHAVAVLPLEDVDDERIVTHAVQLPLLLACDLRRQPLELRLALWRRLEFGLHDDTVEVLVQAVEQEAQELLRIMLLCTRELGRVAAY